MSAEPDPPARQTEDPLSLGLDRAEPTVEPKSPAGPKSPALPVHAPTLVEEGSSGMRGRGRLTGGGVRKPGVTHRTRGRRTFANGALHAARWVLNRRGWYSMEEVLRTRRKTRSSAARAAETRPGPGPGSGAAPARPPGSAPTTPGCQRSTTTSTPSPAGSATGTTARPNDSSSPTPRSTGPSQHARTSARRPPTPAAGGREWSSSFASTTTARAPAVPAAGRPTRCRCGPACRCERRAGSKRRRIMGNGTRTTP